MISAIDTNILLDILIPNARFAESSKALLDDSLSRGALCICEAVYAELAAQFATTGELHRFLADTTIRLEPSTSASLERASEAWKSYVRARKRMACVRCGTTLTMTCPQCLEPVKVRQHILTDFLVGAHALLNADRLLTRDQGYYKSYFPELNLTAP